MQFFCRKWHIIFWYRPKLFDGIFMCSYIFKLMVISVFWFLFILIWYGNILLTYFFGRRAVVLQAIWVIYIKVGFFGRVLCVEEFLWCKIFLAHHFFVRLSFLIQNNCAEGSTATPSNLSLNVTASLSIFFVMNFILKLNKESIQYLKGNSSYLRMATGWVLMHLKIKACF